MSSFCLGCGQSLSEGERFCGSCGRDSQAGSATPAVHPSVAYGIPPETSGKAIFSLVCGIIVLFFPFSIVALVFGYLSLYDIRRSAGRLTGRGVAIAGIVLGYVGVALTLGFVGLGIYEERMIKKSGAVRGIASSETSVVSSVRSLNTAEIAYAQAHPKTGYTCSLTELSGAWGISADLARGRKKGYTFELQGCSATQTDGPIVKYQLVAYPTVPGKAAPAYCSDQSDLIRMAKSGSAQDCLKTGTDLSENEMKHPPS
jgi:Domain of unknown function (DUF4190)